MSTAPPQLDLGLLLRRLDELEARTIELEGDLAYAQRLATLGLFAGAVAHEVSGLLTPSLARARLLLRPGGGGDPLPVIRDLADAAERAAAISTAILGYLAPGEEAIADVRAAVDGALACMGRPPAKEGIELLVSVPPECVARIQPAALQQVLMNLLRNAVKAIRAGAASGGVKGMLLVQASCSTWNKPGSDPVKAVRVVVQDNGPGIPRAILERLFEPFAPQRGSASAPATSGGGLGLGLAICRRLVEAAGGSIEAASPPDGGARFSFWLPAAAGPADAKPARSRAAAKA